MFWYRDSRSLLYISATCALVIICAGACSIIQDRSKVESITDGHFPPWYDNTGERRGFGYPPSSLVMSLPSLTQKQRQALDVTYKPLHQEYTQVHEQIRVLEERQSTSFNDGSASKLSSQQRQDMIDQLLDQLHRHGMRTWIQAKAELSTEQLQELVRMAQESKSRRRARPIR